MGEACISVTGGDIDAPPKPWMGVRGFDESTMGLKSHLHSVTGGEGNSVGKCRTDRPSVVLGIGGVVDSFTFWFGPGDAMTSVASWVTSLSSSFMFWRKKAANLSRSVASTAFGWT